MSGDMRAFAAPVGSDGGRRALSGAALRHMDRRRSAYVDCEFGGAGQPDPGLAGAVGLAGVTAVTGNADVERRGAGGVRQRDHGLR